MSAAGPAGQSTREWVGAALLIALGIGSRLGFLHFFPTLPFWDSLQLVHFGTLMRDHGLAAPGWYWGQFNPGVPMILALLFKAGPDPVPIARTATAFATGLLGLLPFLIWRSVIAFRWRLLAGVLLAIWPGQVFFSGVVTQDNWVLVPTVALGCLAARRLCDRSARGQPLAAGLLYAAGFWIRQEMLVVLLPLVVAAGTSPAPAKRRAKELASLAVITAVALLILAKQREAATGRFTVSTEHGALGLYGSFMPGSSTPGWIDARAYAVALEPGARQGLFGSQRQLVRLTREEIARRPAFHLLRIGAWLPRLALEADADNLSWSIGNPRSTPAASRPAAERFEARWKPILRIELAVIQGLFAASVLLALRERRSEILILAAAVFLKFLVHMVVSPLGRLVIPAVALELMALPLAAEALEQRPVRLRLRALTIAAAVSLALFFATPALAARVIALDSSELPGVREFSLQADDRCAVRCRIGDGVLTSLTPTTARVRGHPAARINCLVPTLDTGDTLDALIEGPAAAEADGRVLTSAAEPSRILRIVGPGASGTREVALTLLPWAAGTEGSLTVRFLRRAGGTPETP